MNKVKSDSEKVMDFTTGTGYPVPLVPESMSHEEVQFICKMIIDEMLELYATVQEPKLAKQEMIDMITVAKDIPKTKFESNIDLIAEQADAFVDIYYYMQNAATKKCVNLSRIFDIVHDANMNKRDVETGKFLKRQDGKIIKPEGWQPPDINDEIKKQTMYGFKL